jgi:multidrug transporter EmrE-like cation transporter
MQILVHKNIFFVKKACAHLHISIFYSTFAAQKIIAIQTAKEVFYQKQTYI